jgi:hypothetical protein
MKLSGTLVNSLRKRINISLSSLEGRRLNNCPLKTVLETLSQALGEDEQEYEFVVFCYGSKTPLEYAAKAFFNLSQKFFIELALALEIGKPDEFWCVEFEKRFLG